MKTAEHLAKHDREIAAIRKLIMQGMKMLVEFQRENREAIREVRAAQRRTDQQLQALIQHLRGSSNGHTKRKVV
jgi:hypothetical protein